MPSFVSTIRGGCKALFTSLTSTFSGFKRWFHREVRPTLEGIISTINRLYRTHVRPFISRYVQFICEHPLPIALGILSIAVIIWPGIVTAPLLALLGFMISGPVSGSIASLTQTILGNIAAGSVFAVLQSAGMVGFGLVMINGAVVGIAALVLAMITIHLIAEWRV
ncbi:uncharacterized protein EAE97_004851 [Botrytis byssoidea]|uniref:Uncharacterized protein n=1 Tax=Botrytis byssoidea TaxID=139641 RepID=A0A9P5INL1_9HELO|nr:uncharacterized protein EAE97_004851 [Botrytis byssoidea]KAF7945813.1 hypothetical protein EAE97_004851 [Botrytis byssoidea]